MRPFQLFSRRTDERKIDFRPNAEPDSPFMQLRRLRAHLESAQAQPDDLEDCVDALNYLREYTYRKVFTGTSHEEFETLDREHPEVIDWLLAVHEIESSHFHTNRNKR